MGEARRRLIALSAGITAARPDPHPGDPSTFDRARRKGGKTATARGRKFSIVVVAEGGFGRLVALRTPDIIDVPLEDAVTQMKAVPVDGDLVRTARALGIELGG